MATSGRMEEARGWVAEWEQHVQVATTVNTARCAVLASDLATFFATEVENAKEAARWEARATKLLNVITSPKEGKLDSARAFVNWAAGAGI